MATQKKHIYRTGILLAILQFVLLTGTYSQQLSLMKADRFGDTGWDFINGTLRLQNGNYVYCGSISGSIPGDSTGIHPLSNINAWIAFSDSMGNIIKEQQYNNHGFDTFTSMAGFGDNILVSGVFQDTLLLDSLNIESSAHTSGFLAVMDHKGFVLDLKRVGNITNLIADIRVTSSRQSENFVVGIYKDSIELNNSSAGTSDNGGYFLTALDSQLEFQAPIFFTTNGLCSIGGIACNDSLVAFAGTFTDTLNIADTSLIPLANKDAFIAVYNSNLELRRIEIISSPEDIEIKGVSISNEGKVGIAGSFKGSALFSDTLLISKGGYDIMAALWDSQGNLEWINAAGSIGNDYGWAIASGNQGHTFVSGSFTHILAIPGENGEMIELQPESFFGDTFIAKYDANGILKASFNLPGTSEDFVSALLINSDNTLVAAGNFYEELLLMAHDSVSYSMESAGSKDIFALNFKDMCADYSINAGPVRYLCPGETIYAEPGFPCNQYLWTPGGKIDTPLEINEPGDYVLMAMNQYGCMASDTLFVEHIPLPVVFAGNDTLVQPGASMALSGFVEMGENPVWGGSGEGYFSPVSGTSTTYYFSNSDISAESLWITLTAENECGLVSDSLKVDILLDDDGITAFPNPTPGIVTLVREENLPMQYVTITNQTGFVIESNIQVNNFEYSYNLQNHPPGTYLFYITTDLGTSCKVINKL